MGELSELSLFVSPQQTSYIKIPTSCADVNLKIDNIVGSGLCSNAEIAGIMFDMNIYSAANPQQGFDGLNARLTFGGQSKLGVVIRIASGEDLQLIVQDDLTGLLAFEIMIEGHIVD